MGSPVLRIEVLATSLRKDLSMTIDSTVDQLRQRMIEDIVARKRGLACRKSHLRAYKRFAAWLQRSPDTATADEIRLFQVHLAETGVGICTNSTVPPPTTKHCPVMSDAASVHK